MATRDDMEHSDPVASARPSASAPAGLDCIIVGYSTEPFERTLSLAKAAQKHGGGYRHLLANSVRFRGKRVRYFDVLNTVLADATGRTAELHFSKIPNLAAHYLANFLRARSFRAEIVNYFNLDKKRFIELLQQRPRCVAITTTFYVDHQPIADIVNFVRQHDPATKIVVGGPRVFHILSDFPLQSARVYFDAMKADVYVFDAQGELTLGKICDALRSPDPVLDEIPNLVLRSQSGAYRATPRLPEDNDLDANAIDWARFAGELDSRIVATRTARGCAFKCAFCRFHVLCGKHEVASVATVERELDSLHSLGVTHLLFIDDTFNVPLPRFKELCRLMIRKGYGFQWFSYFRCANSDDESIDLMAEAGCKGVFLGIESGDPSVLVNMNKKADVLRYKQGIQRLGERDILTYATFVVGFPGETAETVQNTIRFIEETRPTFVSVEPYYHDPKVPIAARAGEFGLVGAAYSWRHDTMDWRQATQWSMQAYKTIRSSTVLPLNDFDFWSIAYLLSTGLPKEEIYEFLRITGDMLVAGLEDEDRDFPQLEEELKSVFEP